AMPRDNPGSLSAKEVYEVTAFLLHRNGIIKETDVIDQETLPKVQMPNRDGFVPARFDDILKNRCGVGVCP
ncbi:MAG: c-type cytochrome, partial [Terriglobia bacterium]